MKRPARAEQVAGPTETIAAFATRRMRAWAGRGYKQPSEVAFLAAADIEEFAARLEPGSQLRRAAEGAINKMRFTRRADVQRIASRLVAQTAKTIVLYAPAPIASGERRPAA